jgi:hypothetical protein
MANTIANPNPITPGVCNLYWVASLSLSEPMLTAMLRPTDGRFVIANPENAKQIAIDATKDAAAKAVVDSVFAQITRLSNKTATVRLASISQPDPSAKISLLAGFDDKTSYRIGDVMAIVDTDLAVASAYQAVLSYLASK